MAISKTFETLFKITAKYQGKPAFAGLNRDIDRTQRNLKSVSGGFARFHAGIGRTVKAIAGLGIAYKAATEAAEFWQMGTKASLEALDIQERLAVTASQNAKRWKASSKEIVDSINKTSERIAALGFDSEDATAGVMALMKSLSHKGIEHAGTAFGNLVAKIKGAQPGIEGFQEVAEMWNQAILRSRSPLFAQLGWTDKQIKAFRKLSVAQREAALVADIQNRFGKEAIKVFGTRAGQIAKTAKAYEDLGQALTEDTVARQERFAAAQERIFIKLLPSAKELGKVIGEIADQRLKAIEESLDSFDKWLSKHETSLPEMLGKIADGLKQIQMWWDKINAIKWSPFIWMMEKGLQLHNEGWGMPARPPQLPGAPSQMPAPGGAGTQGEAARRAEEAKSFYKSGYPSSMPGKIQTSGSGDISKLDTQLGGVLAGHAKDFEAMGKKYGVDPLLLMAIAKFETGSGTSFSARTRNNIAGIMNPKNPSKHMVYATIEEGIEAQAKLFGKYKQRGLTTIPEIGARYSPPGASNDPNQTNASWPSNVARNYKRLQDAARPAGPATPGGPAGSSLKHMIKGMNMRQRTEGASGGTNVAMNPVINVHGVPTGREGAVGQEVAKAMRDPTRNLLDQLKAARSHEARLGYI